jgi:hypothetical protein
LSLRGQAIAVPIIPAPKIVTLDIARLERAWRAHSLVLACRSLVFGLCSARIPLVFRLYSSIRFSRPPSASAPQYTLAGVHRESSWRYFLSPGVGAARTLDGLGLHCRQGAHPEPVNRVLERTTRLLPSRNQFTGEVTTPRLFSRGARKGTAETR